MFGNQGNNPDGDENPNKNLFGSTTQPSSSPAQPTFAIATTDSQTNKFGFNTTQSQSATRAFTPTTTSRPFFGITRKIDNTRPITSNALFGFTPTTVTNVFGSSKASPAQGGFGIPVATTTQPSLFPALSSTQSNVFGGSTTKTTSVFGSTSISSLFGGHNLIATSTTATSLAASPRSSLVSPSKSNYSQAVKQPSTIFGGSKSYSSTSTKSASSIQSKKISDRMKTLSRNVLPPKESTKLHRSDPRTKRLNRTVVSGGLFGQALAGIRQPKPKDSKSTRDVKPRLSEVKSESISSSDSKEKRITTGTAEEISQLNSILCRGVRKEVNTDEFLRNHFSKFGKVTKLYRQVNKQTAHVHFQTHEEADNAKHNGTVLVPGQKPILIFWSLTTSVLKRLETKSKTKAKKEDLTPSISDEMDDELKSMSYNVSELEEDLMGREPKEIKIEPPSRKQEKIPTSSAMDTAQKHKQEHLDLLRIQTKTAKDRFQVLDTRDKLLRLSRIKQSNITTAKAVVGTCPDMCPEKERYFREEGGRLPIFEIADKGSDSLQVDHKLAIKEYTRSSADQEEPLPHDLRSGPVLSMTMDYLVCNIVDATDQSENPAEWYDFLWNRMRAIRKDITQQHLCDLLIVSLIEKCARFHIHCAERLCEEELKCFDPKINNENLTKCLQSLKHFYHDLGVKGIENPREPEFRGYDILLNLNSSDILRQVQQLTIPVQNSPEVIFAIKVFWAVNSNNYVRFFKLVRAATYLNACIMHRYFNQVRVRALHILTRAYCPSTHVPIHFPIDEFVSMLGFDGPDEASEYCILHGLSVDGSDVILDRANISHDAITPSAKRAHILIENKLTHLVGEVVYGGTLPENPKNSYQPHSSFDALGYLKSESLTAEDQSSVTDNIVFTEGGTVVIKREVEEFPTSSFDQMEDFNETIVKELANSLMGESTNVMIYKECEDFMYEVDAMCEFAFEVSNFIVNESTDNFTRDIIDDVFSDEIKKQKLLNEQRINRENEEREIRAKAILSTQNDVLNKVVALEVLRIVTEVADDAEIEYKAKLLEDNAQCILQNIISEFISHEVNVVTRTVYQEDVIDKRERLEVISRRIRLTKARRFFHLWRRTLIRRKRRLKNLKHFPGFPGLLMDNMSKVQTPVGDCSLPMARISQQEKLSKLIDMSVYSSVIAKYLSWKSLDLESLLPTFLPEDKILNQVYCKLVISFPPDEGSVFQKIIRDWVKFKFGDENFECRDNIQTICRWTSTDSKVHFCAKSAVGLLPDNIVRYVESKKEFQGSNAVLFIIVKTETEGEDFWSEQRDRLEQIGSLRNGHPRPSLCLLTFGLGFSDHEVKNLLVLDSLIQRKLFSSINIYQTSDITDVNASLSLERCLKIIMRNSNTSLGLCCQSLLEYLDDVISKYFSKLVHNNLADRLARGLLHQAPENLISYFNFVISWAANIVTSPSIQNISWPAPEFVSSGSDLPDLQWNTEDYLNFLSTRIKDLELSYLPDARDDEDWDVVKSIIWNYIIDAVTNVDLKLQIRIDALLMEAEKTFERNCCVRYRVAKCAPFWENVPWTDILHAIIECKLSNIFNRKSSREDVKFVYYFKEELEQFKPPASWAVAICEKKEKISPSHLSTLDKSVRKRKMDISATELDKNEKRRLITAPVQNEEEKVYGNQIDILLSRIKMEREESRLLEQKLEQSFIDLEEPSFTSTPRVKHEGRRARPETKTSITDKLEQLKTSIDSEITLQKIMDIKLKNISTI